MFTFVCRVLLFPFGSRCHDVLVGFEVKIGVMFCYDLASFINVAFLHCYLLALSYLVFVSVFWGGREVSRAPKGSGLV